MKGTLKDIIAIIPDFEDLAKLADEIGELSFKKMKHDNLIKAKESAIVKEAMTNPIRFSNGKPPSMSYVESTYKYTGFDNELVQDRETLADISAMLEKRRILLSLYRDMMELYRTMSANERNTQAY